MNFWKDKKVLVTGGDGFIGSYLVECLLKDGARVTVASNLEHGDRDNLRDVKKDIVFKVISLESLENCKKVCYGQDVVMNLAAKVRGIEYSRMHHAEMFESNMLLQMMPLKAAAECDVKIFLQVSTACVYPHDVIVPIPESEGAKGEPESVNAGYGWAKRMGETLARFYSETTDMEIAIVRPFNAYGIRDYFDEGTSHVVPALIKKVLDGSNPVEVLGSGNQKRAFVHAKDIAAAMKLVTERYRQADPVNIGHDNEITIKELVQLIQDISGIHNPVKYRIDIPEGHSRRCAYTTKLKAVTGGLLSSIPLRDGLKEMIDWYKELKVNKKIKGEYLYAKR